MKKKIFGIGFASLLALTTLASCGKEDNPSNDLTLEQATTMVSGFDSSVKNTTVKLTYTAKYKVDVDTNGGTANMDSFKHDITATTSIEMDLGSDLYFKSTKTKKDLQLGSTETKDEVLIYKKDNKYYKTSTSSLAKEINTSQALTTINDTLKAVTDEQVGYLTLSSLIYNKTDKNYELLNFGLSDTFTVEDLNDPVYQKNDKEGLDVLYKPEYVGYATDAGVSDFKNTTDGYAATVNISTDKKGYVTDFKEVYNTASLDFAIMAIPPTVKITGERKFAASYGDTLTKATDVTHTKSVAVLETSTGGTYVAKTFAGADFANMTTVNNGDELVLNNVLAIKPTPAEGKVVDTVKLNGSADTVMAVDAAGGFYCFNIVAGNNTIVVTFKDAPTQSDPVLTYKYTGNSANNTVMEINLFNDNTFTVTCPGYNGAKAADGTYALDTANNTITLTAPEGHVNYMGTVVTLTVTLQVTNNFATLTTTTFFNGDAITFTNVAI